MTHTPSIPGTVLVAPARVRTWRPGVVLRPYVESYSLREDWLGELELYNPLPARPDCFLQFYLADRYKVVNVASAAVHRAPRCVLVGPHVRRREDLIWTGQMRMFTIRFTSVGFRALFGLPAASIRDVADAADVVLGTVVRGLEAELGDAAVAELPAIAERFLLECLRKAKAVAGSAVAARMVRAVLAARGATPVRELAASYGLSERQVERVFLEHVGVTPKVFGRLTRTGVVLTRRMQGSAASWAELAAEAGYFDQSHMIREFRELNGATPVQFAELGARARAYRAGARAGDVGFVLYGEPVNA